MWGVILILIVLAAGGLWYAMQSASPASAPQTPVASDTGTPAPSTSNVGSAAQQPTAQAGGTSNAALSADLNAVDTSIQDANSAGASAGSFNDTPVQQTE